MLKPCLKDGFSSLLKKDLLDAKHYPGLHNIEYSESHKRVTPQYIYLYLNIL